MGALVLMSLVLMFASQLGHDGEESEASARGEHLLDT